MTQALIGHGSFRAYLHRFQRSEYAHCLDCSAEQDDAEHTIFLCSRWTPEREVLGIQLGSPILPENLVDMMVAKEENWKAIESFIKKILSRKEEQL